MSTQELNQKINRELGIAEERSNEGYVFGTEIFLGRIDKYAERLGTDVSNFVTDEKRNQIMRTALEKGIHRELGIAEERSNEGYVFGTEIFLGRIDKYAERLGTDVSNFVTDEKRNQIMRTALEKGIHRELGIAEERSNEGYVFGTRLQLEQAEKYAQELRNHPRSVKEIRASNYPMKFFDEAILRLKYYDNSDETLQEGFDLKGKQYDVQLNLNSLILSNKIKKARKELLEN